MARIRAFALTAVALAALSACTSRPPQSVLPTEAFPITVRETRATLEVPVRTGQYELSFSDERALKAFYIDYLDRGHGPVTIALPAGGSNAQSAVQIASRVRDALHENGMDYRDIDGQAYDARAMTNAPVVAFFRQYETDPVECFQEWGDFNISFDGNNTRNFGCASQANLAAMIADPKDLLGPRPMQPADALRRADILDKYRRGETTATQRSDDETATIADAID